MNKREIYKKKINAKLKEWEAEIKRLETKAEQTKIDVEAKYYDNIEELKNKKKQAQKKLENIKDTSNAAWEEMKDGFEKSWNSLAKSFNKALKKFK